jgi:hypothetical protein
MIFLICLHLLEAVLNVANFLNQSRNGLLFDGLDKRLLGFVEFVAHEGFRLLNPNRRPGKQVGGC